MIPTTCKTCGAKFPGGAGFVAHLPACRPGGAEALAQALARPSSIILAPVPARVNALPGGKRETTT